jgi:hypothetical protein
MPAQDPRTFKNRQMAVPGGASERETGYVLKLDMMREFSGQDDVSKADMLVLRGLGLADVQVRDTQLRDHARGTPPLTAVRVARAGSQGGAEPDVAVTVAQRAAPDRAAPRSAPAARRAKYQQKRAGLAHLPRGEAAQLPPGPSLRSVRRRPSAGRRSVHCS